MASVWGELKRRNVVRVTVAYSITGWLILQLTDVLMPMLGLPEWVGRLVILLLVIGFPLALIFAWAFELTPEGIKLEKDVARAEPLVRLSSRKLDFFIIGALTLALVYVIIDQYVLDDSPSSAEMTEQRRSIAVLPFANRSAAEENAAFFADGIHDELLTRLAKIGHLKVISRTSVMEYRDTTKNMREIGEELGVGSILEGGVQRAGNTVRINVQLIDAHTDEHLWADTYDRELSAANIFAIQSEISTSIAKALRATLSPDEQQRIAAVPTKNIKALEAYFIGKQMVANRGTKPLLAAIDKFRQAIELDPGFSLAWSGLAEAWIELPNYSATADLARVRRESEIASHRAVELDPDSPYALAVLGWHRLLHNYDWSGANDALIRALEIEATNVNALHWSSHLLSWQGKPDEAIAAARAAVASDPISALMLTNLKYILADAGMWDEAFELGDSVLAMHPYPSLMANYWIGKLRARRAQASALQIEQWAIATGRNTDAAIALGEMFVRSIDHDETVVVDPELLDQLQLRAKIPEVYAALGDAENTLAALQSAHEDGTGDFALLSMRINPSYDFIRDDPRFIKLLDQIGLAE